MPQDLSHLSDDELEKIANQGSASGPDLSKISDSDLEKIASGPRMSKGKAALIGVQEGTSLGFRPAIGGAGAVVGGVIGDLQTNLPKEGLLDKLKRTYSNISPNYEEARRAHIAEQEKAATDQPAAHFAGNIGGAVLTAPLLPSPASWTGALKTGAIMGAGNAISEGESVDDAAKRFVMGVGTGAALKGVGDVAIYGGKKVIQGANILRNKVGSALTGLGEKQIETYAARGNEVKDMIKASGGEMSEAADIARQKITGEIQTTRQKLNGEISGALNDPKYANTRIDASSVIDRLQSNIDQVSKVTNEFRPGEVQGLKDTLASVKKFIADDGTINLNDLHSVRQELQNIASPSYNNGSLIFAKGDLAAKASKGAAAEARKLVNEAAPEIASANNQLSKLHSIEDGMNRNLIQAGKPEAALIAAGSGGNARNLKYLNYIDQITGGTAVKQAENLSAAKAFQNPQILSIDSTGKAVARMAAGGIAGAAVNHEDPYHGAMIGAAASSPMAWKLALDTQRLIGVVGGKMGFASPAIKNLVNQKVVESPFINDQMTRRFQQLQRAAGPNEQ